MRRTLFAFALAGIVAAPALATDDGPSLTLYHTNGEQLFRGTSQSIDSGYAVVHEQRDLHLSSGTQDVVIDDLPDYLDPEAIALAFPGDKTQVLSQRLLLPRGHDGTLTGHIGKQVTVLGNNGQSLVQGTLVGVGNDGSLLIGGDVFGPTVVHNYAAIKLTGGKIGGGSRLMLRVKNKGSGDVDAQLTYPTSGLAWRAAYAAMLQSGHSCRVQLTAQASIANRSGRAWHGVALKLVAGKPALDNNTPAPRMMMAKAAAAPAAPQQSTLGDYRAFTLGDRVDLPNGSITLTPLYDTRTLSCDRSWVFETGRSWQPAQPMVAENFTNGNDDAPVSSELRLRAFDTFPAGIMRVWTEDKNDHSEFLGQGAVDDTPKGGMISLTLGQAFDLKGHRERTHFHYNRGARTLEESFRVTLDNSGDSKRTVTVIEHPSRWNHWTLTSSSVAADQRSDNALSFQVEVPAKGSATLDYALRYTWSPGDER